MLPRLNNLVPSIDSSSKSTEDVVDRLTILHKTCLTFRFTSNVDIQQLTLASSLTTVTQRKKQIDSLLMHTYY